MKATVIGAGVMGPGIAQVFLEGGFETTLMDISEEQLKKGVGMIELVLGQKYEKKILPEKPEYYMKNLKTSTDMKEAVEDADVVIEAVPEKLDLKKAIYDQITICEEYGFKVEKDKKVYKFPLNVSVNKFAL